MSSYAWGFAREEQALSPPTEVSSTLTNSTVTGSEGGGSPSVATWIIAVCVVLFVLCCTIITRPRVPQEIVRRNQEIRERRQRRRERARQARQDPEKRKELVEQALISKRVTHCDKEGHLTLGDVDCNDQRNINDKQTPPDEDPLENESSACVVCLEPFRVGDVVSWSKSMQCFHVFHRECIMEWILIPKHDDCPSCRCELILQDDSSVTGKDQDEDENQHTSLPFVIMNGLITRMRQAAADYSILTTYSSDEEREGRPPPPFDLQRSRSEGASVFRRSGSFLRVALRRVSTGIFQQRSADEAQLSQTSLGASFPSPMSLRRTISADARIDGRVYRRMSAPQSSVSVPGVVQHVSSLPLSPSVSFDREGGIAIFRTSSLSSQPQFPGAYALSEDQEDSYCSDEEDDLRVWSTPAEEHDIEMGNLPKIS